MPWYFRKSFGSKAFRINLSKGGIGFSTGIPGFRVSTNRHGTYVNMGRGGIYYRQKIGGPWGVPHGQSSPGQPYVPPGVSTNANNLNVIQTASAHGLIDPSNAAILARINTRLAERSYYWIPILITILAFVLLCSTAVSYAWVPLLVGSGITVIVYRWDVERKTYPLFYEFDAVTEPQWQALCQSLQSLAQSHAIWRVNAEGANYDWKRSGGATSTVQRTRVTLVRQKPRFIETNVQPYVMRLGRQHLCFMPDRLLIFEGGRYGAVDYHDLRISIGTTNFIESGTVPSDATVVSYTWQYVNKSGGPDRRFASNRQIPVCLYQVIHLSSSQGLNIFLNASSHAFTGLRVPPQSNAAYPGSQIRSGSGITASHHPANSGGVPHCYSVFGLRQNCTRQELDAAFRAMSSHYQPDKLNHMSPSFRKLAEERLLELQTAYAEILALNGWR